MRFKYNEGNDEEEIKMGELAKKILDVAGVDKAIEPLKLETESLFRWRIETYVRLVQKNLSFKKKALPKKQYTLYTAIK